MIAIGLLLAVAGLSAAQVYPYIPPIQVPVFPYPGVQYPVGFGPQGFVPQGSQGFASRFGGDGGESVGTYAYHSSGTGPVGGHFSTSNHNGFTESRFNDDDGGVTVTRHSGSHPGAQSSSSFVSSSNNGGQSQHHSSSSVTKDGQTTTYHSQG